MLQMIFPDDPLARVTASIIGILFLGFRLWLVEGKCKEWLGVRRRFFSRMETYYMCIAIIFQLRSITFNALIIQFIPSMIFISVWFDILFLVNIKKDAITKLNLKPVDTFWLIVERVTLHVPIIILGFWMVFDGVFQYVNFSQGWWPFIIDIPLICGAFFLMDERLSKKLDWPLGPIIVICGVIQTIGMFIFMAVYAPQ